MADKKFDQFTDGGEMQVGDIPVGLRSSDLTKNFKFDFPGAGIKDSSGNYLFQYATAGAAAVNYPKLINSASTLPVQLTAEGSDSNINISLTPKGTGILVFDGLSWPSADGTANQAIITNGLGILSFGNVPIVTVPTTDNAIARFNGTGGALQNSGVIISDSNAVSGMTRLDVGAIRVESDTISGIGINASIVLSPGGLGVVSANRLKLATDMDTNGFAITTSVINGDILITPNGNGDTVFTNNLEVATANGIQDSNDNLYLQFQSIGAGANNYFIVKNGDNSFAPMLQVAGTPTNLDLSLQTKGTGNYVLLATSVLSSRLQFRELTTNGLGRVTVSAPNAVPVNWVFTLPDAAPSTTSQYLTATTGGISSWSTIPGSDITGNALTKTDDTNVTLTLGGNPTTALLRATSLTLGWTGQLGLTRGGTNASLTASNGGLIYSTATAMSVLAGTATANRVPLSGSSAAPSWSTATYPATTTINQLLYSSAANTITGLAT
ncbi:MAG TPA: hypothetical protein VK616_04435, partial [Flavitalea sp.]|nr:hypothetical protein [Flavitalea sp.]